jgi:hypothetical protein
MKPLIPLHTWWQQSMPPQAHILTAMQHLIPSTASHPSVPPLPPPPLQASKLALERSQATRRLLAEQAIRAALGLKRPKSPGSSIADNGSAGGAAGRLAADGPGSSRRSPYTSARGSPKSGGGRGESPGKARPGASPLKASLAGLALQAGERRPGSSPPQSSGGSRRGRV